MLPGFLSPSDSDWFLFPRAVDNDMLVVKTRCQIWGSIELGGTVCQTGGARAKGIRLS